MTALLLATIALMAALVLVGVFWSLGRAIRSESTGERLLLRPVVEFHCVDGPMISGPAIQGSP